mmetsp:Transcript_34912/g.85514  ORF Transcript_34912/g.85514 Transcript_34912/m.85514 type:complete len:364 (-) Transcript_34912:2035-3126(-)
MSHVEALVLRCTEASWRRRGGGGGGGRVGMRAVFARGKPLEVGVVLALKDLPLAAPVIHQSARVKCLQIGSPIMFGGHFHGISTHYHFLALELYADIACVNRFLHELRRPRPFNPLRLPNLRVHRRDAPAVVPHPLVEVPTHAGFHRARPPVRLAHQRDDLRREIRVRARHVLGKEHIESVGLGAGEGRHQAHVQGEHDQGHHPLGSLGIIGDARGVIGRGRVLRVGVRDERRVFFRIIVSRVRQSEVKHACEGSAQGDDLLERLRHVQPRGVGGFSEILTQGVDGANPGVSQDIGEELGGVVDSLKEHEEGYHLPHHSLAPEPPARPPLLVFGQPLQQREHLVHLIVVFRLLAGMFVIVITC